MKEGYSEAPKKGPEALEGALAASTLRVLNGLQIEEAARRFRKDHPDRTIDMSLPEDRNEVMLEYVSSGGAAEFAASYNPAELHQTLVDIDAPNLGETEH